MFLLTTEAFGPPETVFASGEAFVCHVTSLAAQIFLTVVFTAADIEHAVLVVGFNFLITHPLKTFLKKIYTRC